MKVRTAILLLCIGVAAGCSSSTEAEPTTTARPTTTEAPGLPGSLQGVWAQPSGFALRFRGTAFTDGELDAAGEFTEDIEIDCKGIFVLSKINADRTSAVIETSGLVGISDDPCGGLGTVEVSGDELVYTGVDGQPETFTRQPR